MFNKSFRLKTGEIIHDFTKEQRGWGWNGLSWEITPQLKVNFVGIGVGLQAGHYVMIRGLNDIYKIEKVVYKGNPEDLFHALLGGIVYAIDADEIQIN